MNSFENYHQPILVEDKNALIEKLGEKTRYFTEKDYQEETEKLFGEVPLCGACAGVILGRYAEDSELYGYDPESVHILINKDFYQKNFSKNYTEMIKL